MKRPRPLLHRHGNRTRLLTQPAEEAMKEEQEEEKMKWRREAGIDKREERKTRPAVRARTSKWSMGMRRIMVLNHGCQTTARQLLRQL